MNPCAALDFGLAVDYALLVVTRHRGELATGTSVRDAATAAVRATSHAVFYSPRPSPRAWPRSCSSP
ncbi:MMPL family transporter [Streptomyces sp. NPDC016459]|uniref:MMPL family transporter n=1 Tax=Streptomyces sp. NPDC016459 TaxID=3157190 RepID=UPI0033F5E28E